jgi:hypothetical protein
MRRAGSKFIFYFCNACLLLVLSGCGGSSVQQSPNHVSSSPTSTLLLEPTNTVLPTPTETIQSYQPNDHDPFQANFVERALTQECPSTSKPTDLCFIVTGAGPSIPYGSISFQSFDINFLAPGKGPIKNYDHDPGYCESTTRQGSIAIGADMVMFTASGTWCYTLVHFVYQVSGGTGKFRHAQGKGSIFIPGPTFQVIEYWTGTLTP